MPAATALLQPVIPRNARERALFSSRAATRNVLLRSPVQKGQADSSRFAVEMTISQLSVS